MAFAIASGPPPLKGTNFHPFFYPTCLLLQLSPKYMKRILNFVPLKHIPPFMANAILNFHFCFLNPSLTCTPGKDEFQANFTVKLALQVYYSPSLATHLLWRWKSVIRAKLSMVCQVTIKGKAANNW